MTYAVVFEIHHDVRVPKEDFCGDAIGKYLIRNGFTHINGNLYMSYNGMSSVECVLIIQRLAKAHPWFASCVKDIHMLRIEENSNLMPALVGAGGGF